jgi:glucose uptake protein
MSGAGLAVLATAIAIFITAASMSRLYVTNGRLIIIVAAMVLYTVGNLLMVRIMREIGLGPAVSVATFAQLVLVNIVAFAIFQERPAPLQTAGIVLGAVSMILILLPTGNR